MVSQLRDTSSDPDRRSPPDRSRVGADNVPRRRSSPFPLFFQFLDYHGSQNRWPIKISGGVTTKVPSPSERVRFGKSGRWTGSRAQAHREPMIISRPSKPYGYDP